MSVCNVCAGNVSQYHVKGLSGIRWPPVGKGLKGGLLSEVGLSEGAYGRGVGGTGGLSGATRACVRGQAVGAAACC